MENEESIYILILSMLIGYGARGMPPKIPGKRKFNRFLNNHTNNTNNNNNNKNNNSKCCPCFRS